MLFKIDNIKIKEPHKIIYCYSVYPDNRELNLFYRLQWEFKKEFIFNTNGINYDKKKEFI